MLLPLEKVSWLCYCDWKGCHGCVTASGKDGICYCQWKRCRDCVTALGKGVMVVLLRLEKVPCLYTAIAKCVMIVLLRLEKVSCYCDWKRCRDCVTATGKGVMYY